MTRARQLALLWLGCAWAGVQQARPAEVSAAGSQVLVVTSSAVPAYQEALEGMRQGMGAEAGMLTVLDLAHRGGGAQTLAEALRRASWRVIVTIGADAAGQVGAQPVSAPVISTMVLENRAAARVPSRPATIIVSLQVPAPTFLDHVLRVFPDKTRIGIIRNSLKADSGPELPRGRSKNLKIKVVDCAGPEQLLKVFLSLHGEVDLVWCFPDGDLYNSATVKPLMLASLKHQLPILGFSESFVRAGAVMGVYADFQDMGAQAAELVKKLMAGQAAPALEYPRRVKVAVNPWVTRLFGLSYAQPEPGRDQFVVLR